MSKDVTMLYEQNRGFGTSHTLRRRRSGCIESWGTPSLLPRDNKRNARDAGRKESDNWHKYRIGNSRYLWWSRWAPGVLHLHCLHPGTDTLRFIPTPEQTSEATSPREFPIPRTPNSIWWTWLRSLLRHYRIPFLIIYWCVRGIV